MKQLEVSLSSYLESLFWVLIASLAYGSWKDSLMACLFVWSIGVAFISLLAHITVQDRGGL